MRPLYPLKFEPIFKTMLWGGRRLPQWLGGDCPAEVPIGEAWLVSDVDGSPSRVRNGPWAGTPLRELMQQCGEQLLGPQQHRWLEQGCFPLLLKFIDAQRELSVQVHPNDTLAARLGSGRQGKTEAWVILDRHPQLSRIYAGFRSGVTEQSFREALDNRRVADTLHQFVPEPGDCVFLEAGTVHALGAKLLVFEIQQTSDITYRLYDWDRIDAVTGRPRPLQIEEALACIDWSRGPCHPVRPAVTVHAGLRREGLIDCPYFTLERLTLSVPAMVGVPSQCRILVGLEGTAHYHWDNQRETLTAGEALLVPASIGTLLLVPQSLPVVILECGLPLP